MVIRQVWERRKIVTRGPSKLAKQQNNHRTVAHIINPRGNHAIRPCHWFSRHYLENCSSLNRHHYCPLNCLCRSPSWLPPSLPAGCHKKTEHRPQLQAHTASFWYACFKLKGISGSLCMLSRPIVDCDESCDLVSGFFSWGCFALSRAISWRSRFIEDSNFWFWYCGIQLAQ
jgi:hypothetical protein